MNSHTAQFLVSVTFDNGETYEFPGVYFAGISHVLQKVCVEADKGADHIDNVTILPDHLVPAGNWGEAHEVNRGSW